MKSSRTSSGRSLLAWSAVGVIGLLSFAGQTRAQNAGYALYMPLVESCMDLSPVKPGGRVEAINLETKKVVWIERQRAPQSTGVLATAGGVVSAGAIDRVLRAYDDATGKELWETRLNDVPSNAPIPYSVNGKQYVATGVGNGGAQAVTFPPLVPEIQTHPIAARLSGCLSVRKSLIPHAAPVTNPEVRIT